MADKLKILFVDDEQKVLDGLRRLLHCKRKEWDMVFANSGAEALKLFEERSFAVIVTDMRMPGMSGDELLTEIRKRHPETIRLVLSGQADKDSILQSVGPIHQFMQKPCDAATLTATINRTIQLEALLANEDLKSMVTELESLPILPKNQEELMQKLQTPGVSPNLIGDAIGQDVAMTAKILQLVNSSFFALQRRVSSPGDAVSLLGLETVRSLVVTMQVFSQVSAETPSEFSQEDLLSRCTDVAATARRIAAIENMSTEAVSETYMAGLLHDVGKLVLAVKRPDAFAEAVRLAKSESLPEEEAERRVIGTSHSEIGAFLLGLWAFENPIVESAAYHHCPSKSNTDSFTTLTAVHVAGAIVQQSTSKLVDLPLEVDTEYLERLGLIDRLDAWRDECRLAA